MSYGILTDITKCVGCLECVTACKQTNKLEMDVPRVWQKNDGLSAENWKIDAPGSRTRREPAATKVMTCPESDG